MNRIPGIAAALGICAAAFAAGFAPVPTKTVSQWAGEKRVVAAESGSPFAGKWSNETAPELVEIMDVMSLSHPARRVSFKKARQVGGSECGVNLIGQVIDETPAPIMLVLPSLDEAKKYVKVKLQPTIDETPALKARVREQKSRDEDGSTTAFKKFRGGFLQVTGANSSKGLKMISARVIVYEEVSEYPLDVDNQGDPVDLAEKTANAWNGREKRVFISTPGLKGLCRVSKEFERSDQRHRHVPCPQCGAFQKLEFKQLRVDPAAPEKAFYECAAHGCIIQHHDKPAMLAAGIWVAAHPNQGRQPGFHLNQLYSRTVTWGEIAQDWLESKDDPRKEKVFVTQVLAEEYEEKGDAPDSLKLLGRVEAYSLGKLPPGVLLITAAIDVQADRLEFGVWGWGVGKTSWLLDKGVLLGNTALPETWHQADELLARRYIDAHDRAWPIDRLAVDSGYNTQHVYAWARGKPNVLAVKGMPGHLAPALGTPSLMDVDLRGKKIRRGIRLWPVGTWPLKSEFYANLAKTIDGPDKFGDFPIGYVHLGQDVDEAYCKQLTAESLVTRTVRGRAVREWVSGDQRNEALDIRVYAAAAASHLGIDRFTKTRWLELAQQRGAASEAVQRDLETIWGAPQARPALPSPAAADVADATEETPALTVADRLLAEARRLLGRG